MVKTGGAFFPESYGAIGDGLHDDTDSFRKLLHAVQRSRDNNRSIHLSKIYRLTDTLIVPDNIIIEGEGAHTGFIYQDGHCNKKPIILINSKNIYIRYLGIVFSTPEGGRIENSSILCIVLGKNAHSCIVDNVSINGNGNGHVGFSQGIRIVGDNNIVLNSLILNCGIGISINAKNITISNNQITNNYSNFSNKPWSMNSPEWDGIIMEGCYNCYILNNKIFKCGQSGVYCGGNNSGSDNILIKGNIISDNWNRGIDIGVTGKVTSKNYVSNVTICDNTVFDNREPQIWLYNVNNCNVLANKVNINSLYNKKFGGFQGGRVGVALGNAEGTRDNVIKGNNVVVGKNDTAAITIGGERNVIIDNYFSGGRTVIWMKNNKLERLNLIKNNMLN